MKPTFPKYMRACIALTMTGIITLFTVSLPIAHAGDVGNPTGPRPGAQGWLAAPLTIPLSAVPKWALQAAQTSVTTLPSDPHFQQDVADMAIRIYQTCLSLQNRCHPPTLAQVQGRPAVGAGLINAAHTSALYPAASTWAQISMPLPPRNDYGYSEFDFAVDGSSIAYFSLGMHPRDDRCSSTALRQIRVLNIRQGTVTVVDQLPVPPQNDCLGYMGLALSYPWLVFSVWHRDADTLSFIALNLVSHHRRLLAVSPSYPVIPSINAQRKPTITIRIVGWLVSDGTVTWSEVLYQHDMTATSIHVEDIASGRDTPITVTPWFRWGDKNAWGVTGAFLSGQRMVWTRTTTGSANVILYDRRTKRTVALTHNNRSLASGINGDTVAWIVEQGRTPEGTVRVYDLRTHSATDMPDGVGANVQVGDGLVSWVAIYDKAGAVPVYFVQRHAVRYYLPSPDQMRQNAEMGDVRIFDREVFVPVILHADLDGPRQRRSYRLDIY